MIPTKPNSKVILQKAFEVRDQIHYWHLQTTNYAEHKALNEFYDSWSDLVDNFIETYQGKYGRVQGEVNIKLVPYKDNCSCDYFDNLISYLKQGSEFRNLIFSEDTDMNNILDEMLGLVNKTRYLLTLK